MKKSDALQLGHISQMLQLNDYNQHLSAIGRIKRGPSEYKSYTKERRFEGVIRKSKALSLKFEKKENKDYLDAKNVWL